MVDGIAAVFRCGAAADLDFLAAGFAFGPPSDAADCLLAAARKTGGFDLRADCGCHLERRRSYAWVGKWKACAFSRSMWAFPGRCLRTVPPCSRASSNRRSTDA